MKKHLLYIIPLGLLVVTSTAGISSSGTQPDNVRIELNSVLAQAKGSHPDIVRMYLQPDCSHHVAGITESVVGDVVSVAYSAECDPNRTLAFEALHDSRPVVRYSAARKLMQSGDTAREDDVKVATQIGALIKQGEFPSDLYFGHEGELHTRYRNYIYNREITLEAASAISAPLVLSKMAYNDFAFRMRDKIFPWIRRLAGNPDVSIVCMACEGGADF
jgi:hypothetical protein